MAIHPDLFPRTKTARGVGGKRIDLENQYFRSGWEANWARYLNWLLHIGEIKSWEYEVDTFEFTQIKRGGRFYTPDFKITNKDDSVEYHEVKGYMDSRSSTKIKRMARYYPDVRLIVVDEEAYRAVAFQLSAHLPHWEGRIRKS